MLQVYLSRTLGPAGYGEYSSVLAAVNLMATFVTFGSSGFLLRVFSQEGEVAYRWMRPTLKYIVMTVVATTVCFLVMAAYEGMGYANTFYMLCYLYSFAFIELFGVRKRLEGRFYSFGVWQLVPHITRLIVIVLLISAFGDSVHIAYIGLCVSSVFIMILMRSMPEMIFLKNMQLVYRKARFVSSLDSSAKQVFLNSAPFGLMAAFYNIYMLIPVYLVFKLAGAYYAGLLSACMAIIIGVYTLPSTVFQRVLMPDIQNKLVNDIGSAYSLYTRSRLIMLLMGIVVCGFVVLLAEHIIILLYGPDYVEAAGLLVVLSLCIPLRFINSSAGAFLNSENTAIYKAGVMLMCAVVSFMLTLCLVRRYGYMASGYVLVFIEVVMLAFFAVKVNKSVFGKGVLDE